MKLPNRQKTDFEVYQAFRELAEGKVNTRGTYTLQGSGSTTVADAYISPASVILPMATSAAGKAAVMWFEPVDQKFIVHHDTVTDTATFAYVSLGIDAPS